MTDIDVKGLARLREPFPPEQIGKLPKGGIQLDFVGHGYLTQRLLDVDPQWNWEPVTQHRSETGHHTHLHVTVETTMDDLLVQARASFWIAKARGW